MYNWNQFRNFPKFKNMSAQEQARQYFLYQSNMMMEQSAAALSPAAAAAAAGAGAGGGGRLPVPGPPVIRDKIVFSIYRFCDFLTDSKHLPTQNEFLNYNSSEQENYDMQYRIYRDDYFRNASEYNQQFLDFGGYSVNPAEKPIPDFPEGSVFYKGPASYTNYTVWQFASLIDDSINFYPDPAPPNEKDGSNIIARWGDKDNLINLWKQDGFDVLLPGVVDINFVPAILVGDPLPTTGNPGDILAVRTGIDAGVQNYYAWDPTLGEFTTAFYNALNNNVLTKQRQRRDAHAKAANEAFLANSSFIWAALYVPEYRVVKDLL